MNLRAATTTDFDALLMLNQESEHFLSPLTKARLEQLHEQAEMYPVLEDAGQVVAFVLALREGKIYESPNYRWFQQRYSQFLYVDRVVVAASQHGRGLGSVLYRAVFEHAVSTRVPRVACEYDVVPPNPASARFHQKFGFVEVGRQSVAGGSKQVSLQIAPACAKIPVG